MKMILASTSPFRRKQLNDFGYQFESVAPLIDEERLKNKNLPPRALSRYLAFKKAESLLLKYPKTMIIGADQLVSFNNQILGKPLTMALARKMLMQMSGKKHELITSICVLYKGRKIFKTVTAHIEMRRYNLKEVNAYLRLDRPLQSAGSYKFEYAGFQLVQKIRVSDPSSLIGLPLIGLHEIYLSCLK